MKLLAKSLAILLVAFAFATIFVNAQNTDQLDKVAQAASENKAPVAIPDAAPAPVVEKPAEKTKPEKPVAEEPKDETSKTSEDDEKKRLNDLVNEVIPKPETEKSKDDTNKAKEDASDESEEDSNESIVEESEEDEEKSDEKTSSEEKSDESEEDSDSEESEEDSDEDSTENKSESNEDTNVIISNTNSLQSGHHAAQKDQLVADDENVHVKLNAQEPKKFNQTFLIIAIGVLAVVCFALAVALIIKRRVINSNSKAARSPRNPIYQEVTQTETA